MFENAPENRAKRPTPANSVFLTPLSNIFAVFFPQKIFFSPARLRQADPNFTSVDRGPQARRYEKRCWLWLHPPPPGVGSPPAEENRQQLAPPPGGPAFSQHRQYDTPITSQHHMAGRRHTWIGIDGHQVAERSLDGNLGHWALCETQRPCLRPNGPGASPRARWEGIGGRACQSYHAKFQRSPFFGQY